MKYNFKRELVALCLAIFLIANLYSKAQVINTIAGNGSQGFSGDGNAAVSAKLYDPYGVAVDNFGNVYIADCANHRIRKVNAITGIITTIAGTGFNGYSGDDTLAIAAKLSFPYAVALDDSENVYIADNSNSRVRKVTASNGIITTIAGNGVSGFSGDGAQATLAQIRNPHGIAVDHLGNVYFSDWGNNRIRKIEANTGIITTVAGNGAGGYTGDSIAAVSCELNEPWGVALDDFANIYIGDLTNHRIRKVNATTGMITTVAGTGVFGFSGDGGQASLAKLNQPKGMAIDPFGNIYIADGTNYRVRRIDAITGIITTIAGNGIYGYAGDGTLAITAEFRGINGVALDAYGNLYITDVLNNRIRKVSGLPAAIENQSANVFSTVYPVPSNGHFTIKINGKDFIGIRICDEFGKEVYSQSLSNILPNEDLHINISDLPNGMYILQIRTQSEIIDKRIVVQK